MLIGPLAFVVAGVLVGVSAAAVVARLGLVSVSDRLVGFGTVAVAQVELSLLVSGALFDSLRRPTLLAVNAVAAAAALLCGGRALLAAAREVRAPDREQLRNISPWAGILCVVAAAEVVWRTFSAAVLPPYAWDGLSYHLTTTAEWIQRGKLVTNPLSLCCAHYPLNTELTFVWPGLLLGNDTLVDGVQIGFALLGAAAVAGIARVAGCSRNSAAAAGSIFFLTPVILAQSATNYNDVAFTGMFLCGVFFVLRYVVSGVSRPAYLALAGLGAGFALGSKGTGLIYAGVLLVVVVVAVVLRRRSEPLAAGGAVFAFCAGLILTGAFWYGRNLVDHGNPVYPFDLSIAGIRLFSGPLHVSQILSNPIQYRGQSNWERVLHSWVHDASPTRGGSGFYDYEERIGGFGIVWPWIALPAIAVFVAFAVRRRRDLLLAFILPVAAIFVLQPYQWWSRFTMILPAVGAVAIVFVLGRMGGRLRVALQAVVVGLVLFGAALATGRVDPAGHGHELSAFQVVRLATAPGSQRTLGRLFHYEYRWLDHIPINAPIDVELGNEPRFVYPEFGPRFERTVRALRAPDEQALTRQLRADRPAYVLVGHGSRLDKLASASTALHLVYRNYRVAAYRVVDVAGREIAP
jgi:Dolichyl-phosphate-mannose-protein mannosyltransferase